MKLSESKLIEIVERVNASPTAKPIVAEYAEKLGVDSKTIYRWIKDHKASKRKKRNDFGNPKSNIDKHLFGIAYIYLKSNKTLQDSINQYCQTISESEIALLPHMSTVALWLRRKGISRRHANLPTPKHEMRSLYPNHCHQFDTSVCRYYIDPKDCNIGFIPKRVDYKNKDWNPGRKKRLIRHVMIDHCTGAFYVEYSTHQKIIDYADFFYNAWAEKDDFYFFGVPKLIVTDKDSGLKSHAIQRLFSLLEINAPEGEPYRPWSKGTVEQIMLPWEKFFESNFLYLEKKCGDIEQINAWARQKAIEFQVTRKHSRHHMTRFQAWMKGISGHLRILPEAEKYQWLLYGNPETRTIKSNGKFKWENIEYKVKNTNLWNQKVTVIEHPYLYRENKALTVIYPSHKDNPNNFLLKEKIKETVLPVVKDEYGFNVEGRVWEQWEQYQKLPASDSQLNLETVANSNVGPLDPFAALGLDDIIPFPQKGTPIQIKPEAAEYAGLEIKHSPIEAKIQISDALHRPLDPSEIQYIKDLNKTEYTNKEIQELIDLFRVQSALKKTQKA